MPITPSESAITTSSQSLSTVTTSISDENERQEIAGSRRTPKKWLPWRMNWFKKGSKKPQDDDMDVSVFSSRSGSPSSLRKDDKTSNQPRSPVTAKEEEEEGGSDTSPKLTSLRELMVADKIDF